MVEWATEGKVRTDRRAGPKLIEPSRRMLDDLSIRADPGRGYGRGSGVRRPASDAGTR